MAVPVAAPEPAAEPRVQQNAARGRGSGTKTPEIGQLPSMQDFTGGHGEGDAAADMAWLQNEAEQQYYGPGGDCGGDAEWSWGGAQDEVEERPRKKPRTGATEAGLTVEQVEAMIQAKVAELIAAQGCDSAGSSSGPPQRSFVQVVEGKSKETRTRRRKEQKKKKKAKKARKAAAVSDSSSSSSSSASSESSVFREACCGNKPARTGGDQVPVSPLCWCLSSRRRL